MKPIHKLSKHKMKPIKNLKTIRSHRKSLKKTNLKKTSQVTKMTFKKISKSQLPALTRRMTSQMIRMIKQTRRTISQTIRMTKQTRRTRRTTSQMIRMTKKTRRTIPMIAPATPIKSRKILIVAPATLIKSQKT